MRQKSSPPETPSERLVRDIRRATRKQYSAEEKIRIVLDGLRGEVSIAELCRREGIAESLYYSWSKEFLEAGKRRLAGDTLILVAEPTEGGEDRKQHQPRSLGRSPFQQSQSGIIHGPRSSDRLTRFPARMVLIPKRSWGDGYKKIDFA